MSTSHVELYRGVGGLLLYTPLSSLLTRECYPIGVPSTCECVMDTADLIVFIDSVVDFALRGLPESLQSAVHHLKSS